MEMQGDIARKYWPFDTVLNSEMTKQHFEEVEFLQMAYTLGFKPYFEQDRYGATSAERGGVLIMRGHSHWQGLFGTSQHTQLDFHVTHFRPGADALIAWLRGVVAFDVLKIVEPYLYKSRVTGAGWHLHFDRSQLGQAVPD